MVNVAMLVGACLGLVACSTTVKREQAVATAYSYTRVCWMPEERHVRHGVDSHGIMVHTPDEGLRDHGDGKGWWRPGREAFGMPYQWGGFDTPESFLEKIALGKSAGDIADAAKRRSGDAGTSLESCGIDCSGLVSRSWSLSRPYSTRELPQICDPLDSWDELKAGDILLSSKHVVLFVKWKQPGKEFAAYEAGPRPAWKVSACGLDVAKLRREGYAPWRYRGIRD